MLAPLIDADPRSVGQYRLQGRLGAGGMGAVYLGFGEDGHPAAVKIIRPELAADPEFRDRFRREVAAARRVRGGFVAEVRDADVDSECPWMATDYIEGVSLGAAITERSRLDGPMLINLATGLADALVAVHAAGLVHRDLKPSNILLAWDGPKIIDFGIARDLDMTDRTGTGQVIGTIAWMAPEQLRGERAGPAADIFSWAMCVVFAATGRHPFKAGTPAASVFRCLNEEPDLDGVPETLTGLLKRALDKNPTARPGAVDIVSAIVGQFVLGVADADAVTRRLLGSGWTPPTPPPGPVPTPGLIPEPVSRGRNAAQGRRQRMVLTGVGALILLATGAGLAWGLVSDDTGGGSTDVSASAVTSSSGTSSTAPGATASAASSSDTGPEPSTATTPTSRAQSSTPGSSGPPATTASSSLSAPATEGGRPLGSGVRTTVYADAAGGTVPTWHGPSTNTAFGRRGGVPHGSTVTLYCSVYGGSVTARNTTSRLWDYTDVGWVNDTYTHTGTTDPVVPSCVGNVNNPRLGSGRPRTDTGPFAVATGDRDLPVRSSAGTDEPVTGTLHHGDLVRTVCWVRSTHVSPPPGLSTGSDNWDRLSTGGWIPDAHVYSATTTSAAPPC